MFISSTVSNTQRDVCREIGVFTTYIWHCGDSTAALEFHQGPWCQTTKVPRSVDCLLISSVVLTQYKCMTDRQTDERTR